MIQGGTECAEYHRDSVHLYQRQRQSPLRGTGSKRKRGEFEGAMKNGYIYEVGDIVTMKKPHPCGSKDWEILRVGADFRLKCTGCGHQIMIARRLVEKNTKDLKKKS